MTADVRPVGRSPLLTMFCDRREETLFCPVQVAPPPDLGLSLLPTKCLTSKPSGARLLGAVTLGGVNRAGCAVAVLHGNLAAE